MTTMVAELYDALVAAGMPDEKARKAAEAMADIDAYDQRFTRFEADISEVKRSVPALDQRMATLDQRVATLAGDAALLKWMIGFALAFLVAISLKLFVH